MIILKQQEAIHYVCLFIKMDRMIIDLEKSKSLGIYVEEICLDG